MTPSGENMHYKTGPALTIIQFLISKKLFSLDL